jgi:hypothetical protein
MIWIKEVRQKILGSLRVLRKNDREKQKIGKIIKSLTIKIISMISNVVGYVTAFQEGIFVVFNTFLSLGQVRQGLSQSMSV